MYAVVTCTDCGRNRMIDRSALSSSCPFCGKTDDHKTLRVIFEDPDQNTVRNAISHITGFVPDEPKKRISDPDPHSTLVHRYERCTDPDVRLEILAEGLGRIYGTFTLENIKEIDPKNADRLLNALLETCLISEIGYGVYRA